jgi:Asp-tRNA(Asn)/Glu-tRNA(Gln) amidotransferase A subunit family amidase
LRTYTTIGGTLHEVELPPQQNVQAVFLAICGAESVSAHGPWLRTSKQLYGRGTWERLIQGLLYTAAEYVDAQRLRTMISQSVATTMRTVDVIALPAMPKTAPLVEEHEQSAALPRAPFLDIANLLGAPAISLPCGFDELGLPIGLHLMGRPFEDAMVLQVAAAYERARGWRERVPPLALDEEHQIPRT